jgi:hypothetical protein
MEERIASDQGFAHAPIPEVAEIEDGVHEKGEQIQQNQDGGEKLLAMTVVVLQMIAVILEHIVVLVFDLPAGAACGENGLDRLVGEGVVSGKGIVIEPFARLLSCSMPNRIPIGPRMWGCCGCGGDVEKCAFRSIGGQKKYVERADIPYASVRTLRHTMATHYLARSGDLQAVQERLGHESAETTRIYLAKKVQEKAL